MYACELATYMHMVQTPLTVLSMAGNRQLIRNPVSLKIAYSFYSAILREIRCPKRPTYSFFDVDPHNHLVRNAQLLKNKDMGCSVACLPERYRTTDAISTTVGYRLVRSNLIQYAFIGIATAHLLSIELVLLAPLPK